MDTTSPYKGLEPYEAEDRNRFFGRKDDSKILLAKIFSARVTLFFGATGAGKSSLLQAGVLPALTDPEGYKLNVIYHFRWNPKEDPRLSLKAGMKEALTKQGLIPSAEESTGWRDTSLKEFLEQYELFASDPLVVIIDQFEEIFLYHSHFRFFHDFIQELSDVINDLDLSLAFVISLREDFLAELDVFWDKVPGLSDNRYRLKKLSLEQAKEAIIKPVKEVGFEYEPELVEQLLHDLSGSAALRGGESSNPPLTPPLEESAHMSLPPLAGGIRGEGNVEAPYLQIVCQELWRAEQDNPQRKLSLNRYKDLGGTGQIVRKHFEGVMEQLSLRQQVLAFDMFRYLVTSRGTKMAYRDEVLADEQLLGVLLEDIRPVLDHLAGREARILRLDNRPDGKWYELYHDVFAEIIRDWAEQFQEDENHRVYSQVVAAARKWRTEGKEDSALLQGARLTQAEEWNKKHPETLDTDEKTFLDLSLKKHYRGVWLRRGIVTAITLFAIIAAVAGWYANGKRKEAEYQKGQAIIAKKNAEEQKRQAIKARDTAEFRRQDAEKAQKRAELAEKEAKSQLERVQNLSRQLARIRSFQGVNERDRNNDPLRAIVVAGIEGINLEL